MCSFTPEISIIIPVYNTSKYIERCIYSVVHQTFNSLELILVDDGSTDESGEICDAWAQNDSRVKVIHQHNKGAGAARNAGLQEAKGKYIGFVDSDDWIEPQMFEFLYEIFMSFPDIEIAMCETNWVSQFRPYRYLDTYRPIEIMDQRRLLEYFFRTNGESSNYGIYTKLIKRSILQNFSFVEGTTSEDVMATYFFYTHCKYAVKTNAKLYNYFQNPEGVTKKKTTAKDFEYIDAFQRIAQDIEENNPTFSKLAEINYLRANFTILAKMKIFGFDKTNLYLKEKKRELKKIVRSNFFTLLNWKMSISRKLLLLLCCL